MLNLLSKALTALSFTCLVFVSNANAYEIPRDNSNVNYFYVFGTDGEPLNGKDDSTQEVFFEAPESAESITISVYDPDASGKVDSSNGTVKPTTTEFSIHGASALDSKSFTDGDHDGKWYKFGPYAVNQGKKVGNKYQFKLVAKAGAGDDQNLFKVKVSPDSVDSYATNITFRLLSDSGDKMYFYPEVPAGVTAIAVDNFDLDEDGGVSTLTDRATGRNYPVKDSVSGQWISTNVDLGSADKRRLVYEVKTTNQRRGNAGLRILDSKGGEIPIYFKKGKEIVKKAKPAPAPPINACNQFTFDARSSYDKNNDKITYLWDFGDGTTSEEPVVTHTYGKGGNYGVTLTVSDNSGLHCETATTQSSVDVNTPPTAAFKAPELVCAGDTVSIDASASSDDTTKDLTYNWSFGDGSTGSGKTVNKTYEKGGVYKVNLNVDDNANTKCSSDAASRVIRVNTAPVAEAGKDISICLKDPRDSFQITLDGSGSHDADKDNLSYVWDFGDGGTGEGVRASHVYEQGGNYTARLSVRDDSGAACSASSDSVNIDLSKNPIAVAGNDQRTCAGNALTFDGSGSMGDSSDQLTYTWDFGDGNTATGKTVKHTYAKGGSYTALLKVSNGKSNCSTSQDAVRVHVNSRPTASIDDVAPTCTGDKVSFDASSSSDPDGDSLNYTWDFGDGTVQTGGSKVSHGYAKGGTYKVSVTVDDKSGAACGVSQDSTVVKVNTPPVANAGPNVVCCEDQANSFDGSASSDADGDSLTYNWSFGDGSSDQGAKVSHAYAKSGNYNISLTVDDNSGTYCSTSKDGFTANVNAKPVPVIQIKQK